MKQINIQAPDSSKEVLRSPQVTVNQIGDYSALMVDTDMIAVSFRQEYTAEQTAVDIITPPSGYKVCVRGVYSRTDGTAGEVKLDFLTSGKIVDRVYFAAQNNSDTVGGHVLGAVDEPLTMTISGTTTSKVFVRVNYVFHK